TADPIARILRLQISRPSLPYEIGTGAGFGRLERDADFVGLPPDDPRPIGSLALRNHQFEFARDERRRRDCELGASVGHVADDAVEHGLPAIETDLAGPQNP